MSNNFLITGDPGCGKTTVVESVVGRLRKKDYRVGGIFCLEIRSNSSRKGFEIIDIMNGDSKILAHVDKNNGPRVSKYRVDIENVDKISESAISKALEKADVVVIDEIAPMEIYSNEFKIQVTKALDSKKPLLAVIHKRSQKGFIGEVKNRKDSEIFIVTKKTVKTYQKDSRT